jgi:hypothetical protein
MVKRIPLKCFQSFEEAQKDSDDGILAMKPIDRVAAVEILRRRYFKIKNIPLELKVKRILKIVRV